MKSAPVLLVVLALLFAAWPASAGPVTDRVKARGAVRCGSARRPGIADTDGAGHWKGLAVDVCRAVATAFLGSSDAFEYHEYNTDRQFDAVREGRDDVYFLTGSEIDGQRLAGVLVPGPAVFYESQGVMVPEDSPVRRVGDLAGKGICFLSGGASERSLSDYFERLGREWLHMPFSEEGEMMDAYDVGHCAAVAGEATDLAGARLDQGVRRLRSRLLPERLSVFPIIAATGTEDGRWSAVVAWTVITLVSGERKETAWYAGGPGAMPAPAPELGLDSGWQARVLSAVGSYRDIFERDLGKGSKLHLDRGPNAETSEEDLPAAPFLE